MRKIEEIIEFMYFDVENLDQKIEAFVNTYNRLPSLINLNENDYDSFFDEALNCFPSEDIRTPINIIHFRGITVKISNTKISSLS